MEVKENLVKQQLDIIYRPHPILPSVDCKFARQEWKQGQTVREILIANGVDQQQPIVVIVNDRMLTVAEWDTVCPDPQSIINVKAEVTGGGGGGNKVLNTVLMIAVVVVAIALAAPTGGLSLQAAGWSATAAYAASAAVMIAGSLLVNTLVPIRPPSATGFDSTSGNTEVSPTYSISGGQNGIRPYQSMPIIMGNHRFFPDLASKPYTQYLSEDQYLYQIFHLGLTPIPASDLTDWRIGNNQITNYTNLDLYWQDQDGKIAFPGNVDSETIAPLTFEAGWITRTTSSNTYMIGIDIDGVIYYANNNGGLDTRSVDFEVEYKLSSSSTWTEPTSIRIDGYGFANTETQTYNEYVEQTYWDDWEQQYYTYTETITKTREVSLGNTVRVSGNSQKPRRASLFIDLPSAGQYDVRLKRTTADSTESREQKTTNWTSLKSYQLDEASYVGQNRVGMKIKASEQLNGIIQKLSIQADASAIYWNGSTWVWDKTSNPAHWYMDFARGRYDSNGKLLYGIGLSDSQIDLAGLNAWATFCNEEGLTFNAVFDGSQTAADILTTISRCGFASPSWSTGKLGAIWDARNQTPVATFGMGNIIKGSFSVSYATESLADEIVVRYVNPSRDWEQDEVRVTVPGVTDPTNTVSVDLLGCTSQSMAGKFANYVAAQQYYRKRKISWDVDFEGFVCQRGDVVLLSHDLTQWGYSGRIVNVFGNTVYLDREVPRSGIPEYIMIRQPDGTMTTYTVIAGTGNSDTLQLTSTPSFQSGYMPIDHIWSFSPLATPGKKVKIVSVQPKSESLLSIIATDENPAFYAAWDGTFNVPVNKTLLLDSTPTVSNVTYKETLYVGNDKNIRSNVKFAWSATGAVEHYSIRYRINETEWISLITTNPFIDIDTVQTGKIEISIIPVLGSLSGASAYYDDWIYGVSSALADVTGLTSYYSNGKTVLTWDKLGDPREFSYEIRKGDTWARAQVLGRVIDNSFVTDGDGTYWVAAYFNGQYSPNPDNIIIDGAVIVANVVQTWDEDATGWSGIFGDDAIYDAIEGYVTLASSGGVVSTYGTYEIPSSHIVDVGYSAVCNVSCSYNMNAEGINDLVSQIPVFSAIPSLVGNFAGEAGITIQIAIAPDSGVFGDWKNFVPGTYFGRKFKVRAVLESFNTDVAPVLSSMIFTVDMPDRYETGTAVSVGTSGLTVTYPKPFQVSPNVQITIVNATAGDDAVLTSQSTTGFTVAIKNSGSNVARTINWLAQGY